MDPKLSQLKLDFAQWRSTRQSKRLKTPDDLKARAIALVGSIKIGTLCSELGISHSALQKWRKSTQVASKTQFAQLEVPLDLITGGSIQIHLERPDGVKLTINGVSESILASFVGSFVAGGAL